MFPLDANYVPRSLTIMSVYPLPKISTYKHIGQTEYRMPAADRGKIQIAKPYWQCPIFTFQKDKQLDQRPCENGKGYSLLRIYDTFQQVLNPASEMREERPILVESVRDSLLREWVSNAAGSDVGAKGPGIIAIAGEIPTQKEFDQAHAVQHEYFAALVQQARDHYTRGESVKIRQRHRVAGQFLGVEGEAWLKLIRPKTLKSCPNCGEDIDVKANGCKTCGIILVEYYTKMKAYGVTCDEQEDPVTFALLQRVAAAALPGNAAPAAEEAPVKLPIIPPIQPPPSARQAQR